MQLHVSTCATVRLPASSATACQCNCMSAHVPRKASCIQCDCLSVQLHVSTCATQRLPASSATAVSTCFLQCLSKLLPVGHACAEAPRPTLILCFVHCSSAVLWYQTTLWSKRPPCVQPSVRASKFLKLLPRYGIGSKAWHDWTSFCTCHHKACSNQACMPLSSGHFSTASPQTVSPCCWSKLPCSGVFLPLEVAAPFKAALQCLFEWKEFSLLVTPQLT